MLALWLELNPRLSFNTGVIYPSLALALALALWCTTFHNSLLGLTVLSFTFGDFIIQAPLCLFSMVVLCAYMLRRWTQEFIDGYGFVVQGLFWLTTVVTIFTFYRFLLIIFIGQTISADIYLRQILFTLLFLPFCILFWYIINVFARSVLS